MDSVRPLESAFSGAASRSIIERQLVGAVSISTVNPVFGGPGEAILADAVADQLLEIGLTPMQTDSRPDPVIMSWLLCRARLELRP